MSRTLALLFAALLPCAGTTLDPGRDLIAWWPAADLSSVRLLHEIGVNALVTPIPAEGSSPEALLAACRAASMLAIAEIPPEPSLEALGRAVAKARELGFQSAAISAAGDEKSLQEFVRKQNGFISLVYLKPEQISWQVAPAHAVLRSGTWPGIHPLDTDVASASGGIWVDANSSLIAYLRGVYPERPAILGYRPDEDAAVSANRAVPYESVEIALADAFAAGGSVILSFPNDYRLALLRGDPQALAAWKSLGGLAALLKQQRDAVRPEPWSRTAVIAGDLEQSGEVLNLAYRHNLSAKVLDSNRLPTLTAAQLDVVAAVNVPVPDAEAKSLMQFAAGGGTILAAPSKDSHAAWWSGPGARKVQAEKDRDVYAVGQGKIYAYPSTIEDPGEFALDLKEAAGEKSGPPRGPKNLDLRVWEAETVLGVLHRTSPGRLTLVLTNYGSPVEYDFLIGVRGQFRRATIVQAGVEGTKPLKVMQRPGRVECNLKRFARLAIVVFEE